MTEYQYKEMKEMLSDIAKMLHDLLLVMDRRHSCKLCDKYS